MGKRASEEEEGVGGRESRKIQSGRKRPSIEDRGNKVRVGKGRVRRKREWKEDRVGGRES